MSDPNVIVSAACSPIGGLLGDFSSPAAGEPGTCAARDRFAIASTLFAAPAASLVGEKA